jgi:hypothetical protein
LTYINDTTWLVGADTMHMRYPNAWLQGGNSFGSRGILGTKDNHHLDFITNNTQQARLDSAGNLLLGSTTSSVYKLDVTGSERINGGGLKVTPGDGYDITLAASYPNGYAGGVNGSMVLFGSTYASVGVNKQALGLIPYGSLILGGTSPYRWVTLTDGYFNPVFVVDGTGKATINGGYNGITTGGSVGGSNAPGPSFSINGGFGTGTGTPGDIVFSTGTAQASGTTIHAMTNRWWLKGGTGYLANSSSPTSAVDITGANGYSQFRMRTTYTPTSSSDTNGNTGDFSWDSNYLYIKTASGWKRAALTTF